MRVSGCCALKAFVSLASECCWVVETLTPHPRHSVGWVAGPRLGIDVFSDTYRLIEFKSRKPDSSTTLSLDNVEQ